MFIEPEKIITDKRGYSYPVLHESKPFANRTKTNCRVTDILMHSKKRFTVNCSDGSTYDSKFVLVTVSTGVLQANTIKFTPPLPSWKSQAVSMFPMCHYCKIFLKFSDVFWDKEKAYIMISPTIKKGYFIHWQNLDIEGLFVGSKILLATLTGELCKESHSYSDARIIDEAYEVLKKVYPNATKATGINNLTLQTSSTSIFCVKHPYGWLLLD